MAGFFKKGVAGERERERSKEREGAVGERYFQLRGMVGGDEVLDVNCSEDNDPVTRTCYATLHSLFHTGRRACLGGKQHSGKRRDGWPRKGVAGGDIYRGFTGEP